MGAEFVWRMEDVLELYERPSDPLRPVLCFDETPDHDWGAIGADCDGTGQPERDDSECTREGVVNLLMVFQPVAGWRHVYIRAHRTKEDLALVIKELLDVQFPEALGVKSVMDNLNTRTPASFYEMFPPDEARRLTSK